MDRPVTYMPATTWHPQFDNPGLLGWSVVAAYLLASAGDPTKQKIDFDAVVWVMLETGRDMSEMYKETAKAGLAACSIRC